MKKSFSLALLLIILMASIPSASLPAPPSLLYIYNLHSLPADITPLYISGDSVLAFRSKLTPDSSPGQVVLEFMEGDYYLMRIKDKGAADSQFGLTRHVIIGDAVVFKGSLSDALQLSKFGWGLTKLEPIEKVSIPVPVVGLPTIASADSEIVRLISAITPEASRQPISDLSAISTRYSYTEGCRQAEQYVFNKFDSLGLATSFFAFQYSGTDMRDVIGQMDGVVHPESIIIVCASRLHQRNSESTGSRRRG